MLSEAEPIWVQIGCAGERYGGLAPKMVVRPFRSSKRGFAADFNDIANSLLRGTLSSWSKQMLSWPWFGASVPWDGVLRRWDRPNPGTAFTIP